MRSGLSIGRVTVLGAELTQSQANTRIFLTAGGLALLGVLLASFTVWWWRSTKTEHPALGPLEVMSDRRWFGKGDVERQRIVDGARPDGAEPLAGGSTSMEPVDLAGLASGAPKNFDDLKELDDLLGLLPVAGVPASAGEPDAAAAIVASAPSPDGTPGTVGAVAVGVGPSSTDSGEADPESSTDVEADPASSVPVVDAPVPAGETSTPAADEIAIALAEEPDALPASDEDETTSIANAGDVRDLAAEAALVVDEAVAEPIELVVESRTKRPAGKDVGFEVSIRPVIGTTPDLPHPRGSKPGSPSAASESTSADGKTEATRSGIDPLLHRFDTRD